MKIGLVFPGFAADATDWCIPALTNLVRALAARPAVEVHVFTLRYPPRQATYHLHGATVHAFGGAAIGGHRLWGVSLGLLWAAFLVAVRREHQRAPFRILHGFWATESGYLAARAGRHLGIPTLVHLAGGELIADRAIGYGNQGLGLPRLLVARSLHLATRITVPSSYIQAQLQARYPQHAAKAVAWPLGVDIQRFTPRPAPEDETADDGVADQEPGSAIPQSKIQNPKSKIRLIHVASLLPVKAQDRLLAGLAVARAQAPQPAIGLTIVGQGPQDAALRALVARLGLGAAVTFRGAVDHAALPALYRAHDAFVLTSRHEAQCLAVLEAAACGLPWIGPPVGALADLARDGPPSGWPVAATPAALGQALVAATAPAIRAERGRQARARVEQAYALERQVDRLLALYGPG
ncbi:MAG TPA: glycosyltransferase family 4 protein [Chloroflexia bacterium]|nr:glycosyltransferase family 4 protein [Chloroflexia bacterium]